MKGLLPAITHIYFQWLQSCMKKIGALGVFEEKLPNHVLVNEYLAGQGIMVRTLVLHPCNDQFKPFETSVGVYNTIVNKMAHTTQHITFPQPLDAGGKILIQLHYL